MTPLAGMRIPMALASKMHALVNDKAALKAFHGGQDLGRQHGHDGVPVFLCQLRTGHRA
ncbi:hypothetical protein [Burkholderia multivorans]|uniref:hypothetical protein n=1 Tax=Burkholderia multivorans TaxID=87883 RepID=UPI001C21D9C7|nr:hypothetical protein [Burkholderia multivorans]MBU9604747.1 hypothetical protein [Burkholderia multivorans]MBU9622376.1 hypothetical protein [Burkholderia multivorans]